MSLVGQWRIVAMDLWDRQTIDLLGPGFIEFSNDGTGRFRFIAVEGWLDCRDTGAMGTAVEFAWNGSDEGDQAGGWGCAVLEEDGSLRGRVSIHLGDESGFRAIPGHGVEPGTRTASDSKRSRR